MAIKTKAEINAEIDAKITANNAKAITGAILNSILHDIVDSPVFGIQLQGVDIAISTTPTTIVFPTPMPSTGFIINVQPFNGIGEPVDVAISNKTVNGFDVSGAVAGFIDYIAIHP